jgi:hypothetical protein
MRRMNELNIRKWKAAVVCLMLVLGAGFAGASPHGVQVNPRGFTVLWQAAQPSLPAVSIYADAGGVVELTDQLRVEIFAVETGNLYLPDGYAERAHRRVLQEKMRGSGIMLVRVSGCQPDTVYYVRGQETPVGEGPTITLPATGPLPSVRTAATNGFVSGSRQLLVEFSRPDLAGRALLLETPASPYGLTAVIGDGAGINQAFFNLDDFLDPSGSVTGGLTGENVFTLTLLGDTLQPTSETTLSFTGTFTVADAEVFVFVLEDAAGRVAGFEFGPIANQTVGVPFSITIRAVDSFGRTVPGYAGNVQLTSSGSLSQGGGISPPFEGGVLASYLVAVNQPGLHSLAAGSEELGRSGQSSLFTVETAYSFWELENYPDATQRGPLVSGPFADPGSKGMPNLLRYALHLDSHHPDRGSLPSAGVETVDGEAYLTLTYRRAKGATDLVYQVEAGSDLGHWSNGSGHVSLASVVDRDTHELVTVRDNIPISAERQRFMRLRVGKSQTFAGWQGEQLLSGAVDGRGSLGAGAISPIDGVPNLIRYALGLDPSTYQRHLLPMHGTMEVGDENYLFLSYTRPKDVEDVEYRVEVSSNLMEWYSGEEYTMLVSTMDQGDHETLVVRDRTAHAESQRRFIRLRILRP